MKRTYKEARRAKCHMIHATVITAIELKTSSISSLFCLFLFSSCFVLLLKSIALFNVSPSENNLFCLAQCFATQQYATILFLQWWMYHLHQYWHKEKTNAIPLFFCIFFYLQFSIPNKLHMSKMNRFSFNFRLKLPRRNENNAKKIIWLDKIRN